MIADQNFYDICFAFFNPTASATAYGQRPKFSRANIRLRPKVKIVSTVQHWHTHKNLPDHADISVFHNNLRTLLNFLNQKTGLAENVLLYIIKDTDKSHQNVSW